jgi:hypothetical protein
VSIGSLPGKKVTFTVVPGCKQSAKLSILLAPAGVTSIDQFATACLICSIVACIAPSLHFIKTTLSGIETHLAIAALSMAPVTANFRRAE